MNVQNCLFKIKINSQKTLNSIFKRKYQKLKKWYQTRTVKKLIKFENVKYLRRGQNTLKILLGCEMIVDVVVESFQCLRLLIFQ